MLYVQVAIGEHYLHETRISAKTIKQNHPNASILLYTDQPPENIPNEDKLYWCITKLKPQPEHQNTLQYARSSKIRAIIDTLDIQNRFIYLDTDIYLAKDPSNAFEAEFDIAGVMNTWRQQQYRPHQTNICTGALYIRATYNTRVFLNEWYKYHDTENMGDQHAFNKTIDYCPLHLHVLPTEYNAIVSEPNHFSGEIKIAHGHYTSISNPIMPTVFLNQRTQNRVWLPNERKMVCLNYDSATQETTYETLYVQPEHELLAESIINGNHSTGNH